MSSPEPYKIVVVGDGNTGKTCLLMSYIKNEFPIDYVPTIFDNFTTQTVVDNNEHKISLWDTAGQEVYENLRTLCYPNTKCFILCYAINIRQSYANIINIWIPEIRHYSNNAAIVLVGTKSDLRVKNSSKFVTTAEGKRLCSKVNADSFIESSAKIKHNISEIFVEAVRAIKKQDRTLHCSDKY
ncbi:ras-like GTP-binding protein RhoL [Scaptodrosophila lebanonensis]|uniref:Ras-like GTP-binding protein RhoL n=1 Tax=Drosophila lebanonensis TaxID=7225 RepID=A0A6J2TH11_DROLE|nr:ras-like GTP-binding protein RhoL [Scaptodrosophila lebanonensis]